MAYNIYLGNLPQWVTADDIKSWIEGSDLVTDSVRVIRDFETQESKGYAFVEAPNSEEMQAIIQRFHRAPIEGRLLQAKEAHPTGERPARPKPSRKRRRPDQTTGGVPEAAAVGKSGDEQGIGNLGEVLQKAL